VGLEKNASHHLRSIQRYKYWDIFNFCNVPWKCLDPLGYGEKPKKPFHELHSSWRRSF